MLCQNVRKPTLLILKSRKSGFALRRYQEKSRISAGSWLQEQSRLFFDAFLIQNHLILAYSKCGFWLQRHFTTFCLPQCRLRSRPSGLRCGLQPRGPEMCQEAHQETSRQTGHFRCAVLGVCTPVVASGEDPAARASARTCIPVTCLHASPSVVSSSWNTIFFIPDLFVDAYLPRDIVSKIA